MDLQDNIIRFGLESASIYRRRFSGRFGLQQQLPWQDAGLGSANTQISSIIADEIGFDLVLDDRLSVFKLAGKAQGSQPSSILQSDGVLTIAARDMASLQIFILTVRTEIIFDALQKFSAVKSRMKRLVLRMPTTEFPTYVYLDLDVFSKDQSRFDLAVKVSACVFVPRLVVDIDLGAQMSAVVRGQPRLSEPMMANKLVDYVPKAVGSRSLGADLQSAAAVSAPKSSQPLPSNPNTAETRRRLNLIIPLTDDLRTSFLGFGYSVGVLPNHSRVLEIGAFRRNFRSSYSRLMSGTDVVDLKAQPLAEEAIADLQNALQGLVENSGSMTCFIGSEVLSADVLAIFRGFAQSADLEINAVVCSAVAPTGSMMGVIQAGLDGPNLHLQTVCFVAAGEPSGFKDAIGRSRNYFGVPPVEGQSMARFMEFRSNVEEPGFSVPASISPREAHALERFVAAFRPLHEDLEQNPAA